MEQNELYVHMSHTAAMTNGYARVDWPDAYDRPRINVHAGSVYMALDEEAALALVALLSDALIEVAEHVSIRAAVADDGAQASVRADVAEVEA